jgi:hypothetical protein
LRRARKRPCVAPAGAAGRVPVGPRRLLALAAAATLLGAAPAAVSGEVDLGESPTETPTGEKAEPSPAARRQAQRLMNAGLPFAEQMLAEHGRFYPFGTVLLPDGLIRAVGAAEDLEQSPELLYESMLEALRAGADDGSFRAAATFTNVEMRHPDGHTISAVHVALEHDEGYCVDVYFPIERDGDSFGLGESFAGLRAGTIFAACMPAGSTSR